MRSTADKDLILLAEPKLCDAQKLLGLCNIDLGILVWALLPLLYVPLVGLAESRAARSQCLHQVSRTVS